MRSILRRLNSSAGRVGISLSALNYGQAAVGLLINLYLARQLGSTGYGLFSFGLVIGTIVYVIVNFGAERTLVRDLVQLENKSQIMTASLVLRALLGLATLLIIILSLPLWVDGEAKRIVVTACAVASVFWAASPTAWFDSRYQMHYHALITFCERLIYAALVLWLITSDGASGAVSVAFLLLITRASSAVIQLLLVHRTQRFDFSNWRPNTRWLLSTNRMIVLAAIAGLFISHWNQLVLERESTAAQLGYYALAFRMTAVVTLLQDQILRLFFPKIAALTAKENRPSVVKSAMIRYTAFSSSLSFAIVLPLYVGAPFLLAHFFPAEFHASLAPLRILCVWAVYYGGARIINAFLISYRLEREFFWSSLAAALLSVGLGWLFIPEHGGAGVALALLISHPVSALIQIFFVNREIRRRSLDGPIGDSS